MNGRKRPGDCTDSIPEIAEVIDGVGGSPKRPRLELPDSLSTSLSEWLPGQVHAMLLKNDVQQDVAKLFLGI